MSPIAAVYALTWLVHLEGSAFLGRQLSISADPDRNGYSPDILSGGQLRYFQHLEHPESTPGEAFRSRIMELVADGSVDTELPDTFSRCVDQRRQLGKQVCQEFPRLVLSKFFIPLRRPPGKFRDSHAIEQPRGTLFCAPCRPAEYATCNLGEVSLEPNLHSQ